jgi:hypothetical protein
MPLKQCTKDGKTGWQYGGGTCYTGPNAKRNAARQAAAMYANGYREGKEYSKDDLPDMLDVLSELKDE